MARFWIVAVILALELGCSKATAVAGAPTSRAAPPAPAHLPAKPSSKQDARPSTAIVFTGMCDASGAVPISANTFVVADDEDNILRLYDATHGGAPISALDFSSELGLVRKGRPDTPGKAPETDIEAAARIGDTAYFITSHGRSSSGKLKPERLRFFATSLSKQGTEMKMLGSAYTKLLDDLFQDPRLSGFGLREAAKRAPKEPGALNIEGLTARNEGGVWIGFRNPNPGGKALIVPLLNPDQTILGHRARLGDPMLLDLGGLGIRSLSSWRGRYLIAAGHFSGEPTPALYTWDGASRLEHLKVAALPGLNPEGFFTPEEQSQIMLLSDDGAELIDGQECKRLADSGKKRFRGLWLTPAD